MRNNSMRAKSVSKPQDKLRNNSRNRSEISHISKSRISKASRKSAGDTKKSNKNSKRPGTARQMFVNNYSKIPAKNGTGAATTFQRHAVPLQKAAKKGMLSTKNNSSESGSMYLDKSAHISLGKNLKSYRYTQMKPVWKAEWDLHGRRKEAAYANSRLASHDGRKDKSTCTSQQRAHKLKNIGTHLVSKSTLGGGPSRLHRPLSRKNTSAVNASTLLPRKTKPSLL